MRSAREQPFIFIFLRFFRNVILRIFEQRNVSMNISGELIKTVMRLVHSAVDLLRRCRKDCRKKIRS